MRGPLNLTRRRSPLQFFDFFGEDRDRFEQIANNAVISNVEDGSFRIFINSNDGLRVLHADEMLYGAGDANGHVQLWRDGLA